MGGGEMNGWRKHQNVINSCETVGDWHFLSCTVPYFQFLPDHGLIQPAHTVLLILRKNVKF